MSRVWMVAVALALVAAHQEASSAQERPAAGQGASPGLLLIASMDESKVDIVDESTLKTVASLNTGKGPHEVRVAPDGMRAYVVAGRTITAIDLQQRAVRATFDLGDGLSAHDVRISRDGKRLWAACAAAQTVVELDTEKGAVLNRYPTGRDGAWFVEVVPDESKLYTPNLEGTSVSAIARSGASAKVMPLDFRAYGIDVTPDGRHVLVSGRALTVVDTSTDAVVRTIATTAPDTGRIRITPDGQRVVVAMIKSLAVFEIASGRLIREIPLPARPKVLTLSGDGRRAYLTNPEAHSASIVDLADGGVSTLPTGRRPDGIAWAPNPMRIP
jgi:DNA-binding beta-propeller fold protein YncE